MTNKKTRITIPMIAKIRAELQSQIDSECPFCRNTDVGHFQIHHIDENPANNEIENLIFICPNCHSKITKGDISQIEVFKMKILTATKQKTREDKKANINFHDKVGNAIIGNNNNISIKKSPKKQKDKYPQGCIGYDTVKANYIGYLIKRYNEYKKYDEGKENMKYGAFGASLKRRYKIGPTRTIYNVPIERFDELSEYIQMRINNTKLAKIKGVSHKNYSDFSEYQEKYG